MASPAGGLSRHSERSLSQFLDPITKLGTLLILGSYAIGYLIVVINEQSHGFLETSLFKPRAITAGAVFILFLGLPFAITQGTFFKKGETNDESPFEAGVRFLLGVTDYLVACSAAAIGMMLVSVDQFHGPSAKPRTSVAFLVLMWVVAANSHLRFSAPKSYHRHPIAWTVFAIVCLGALIFSFYTLRGLANISVFRLDVCRGNSGKCDL